MEWSGLEAGLQSSLVIACRPGWRWGCISALNWFGGGAACVTWAGRQAALPLQNRFWCGAAVPAWSAVQWCCVAQSGGGRGRGSTVTDGDTVTPGLSFPPSLGSTQSAVRWQMADKNWERLLLDLCLV